jgi:hypothetical protein
MFKSIAAKFTGVGAAAVLLGATGATPASAFSSRPCYETGPQITAVVQNVAYPTITGTCFPAYGQVVVHFTDTATRRTVSSPSFTASGSGTFSTQELYAAYNGSETVVAVEPSGDTSNTITIAEPWVQ